MEIPIFPLPLVFFPQVLVPLHIFEERYRLMVKRCVDESASFGIVFIPPGSAEDESTIRTVGVAARIVQFERLEDGRFNIVVAGEKRFRIKQFTGNKPYWKAEIEFFEDSHDGDEELQENYDEVLQRYLEVRRLAARLQGVDVEDIEVTKDPMALSCIVSSVLDVELESKQELLEMTSTTGRLKALVIYLEEVIQRMNSQIAKEKIKRKVSGNGHFSLN